MGNIASKDDASGSVTGPVSDDPDPSPSARRNSHKQQHKSVKHGKSNDNEPNYTTSRPPHRSDRKRKDLSNEHHSIHSVADTDLQIAIGLAKTLKSAPSLAPVKPTATSPPAVSPNTSSGSSSDSVISPQASPASLLTTPKLIPKGKSVFGASLESTTDSCFTSTSISSNSSTSPLRPLHPIEESHTEDDLDDLLFDDEPDTERSKAAVARLNERKHRPGLELATPPVNGQPDKTLTKQSVDIDSIIERLVKSGLSKKTPKKFMLTPREMMFICSKARIIFMSQPMLLELAAPVKIAGDIHGQFHDLLRVFKMCGFPPSANYLFLGDYVDRGKQSLETIMLMLCLKVKFPENFFMLRGNHESAAITRMYGFYDECKRRSSIRTWKMVVDVFNTLPAAATIAGRIFCVHGGLSPQLTDMNQIKSIQRPTDIPEEGLLADLLWSDPKVSPSTEKAPPSPSSSDNSSPPYSSFLTAHGNGDWTENDRGVSYCFSRRVVARFCQRFDLDLIARGHMVVEEGYEFYAKRKLVTVFTAPNYCGEFDNWGAVMNVDKKLMCSFELLKPRKK